MKQVSSLSITFLLFAGSANAVLRGAGAKLLPTPHSCELEVGPVGGLGMIEIDPDIFVISAEVKSKQYRTTGEKATEVKTAVDAAGIDGVKYSQSFRQESRYDSKLREMVLGDFVATVVIKIPYQSDEWKTTGSDLLQKILSINQSPSVAAPAASDTDDGYRRVLADAIAAPATSGTDAGILTYAAYGQAPQAAYGQPSENITATYGQSQPFSDEKIAYVSTPPPAPAPAPAAFSIVVTSTGFQVSHKLRSTTEKQALALAVKDAIANIGQSASPWLRPTALKTFSADSLANVRISTKPNSQSPYQSYDNIAYPMARSVSHQDSTSIAALDLMYVDPGKSQITQSVYVSACVVTNAGGN
jgi:hypothetical protein